MTNAVLEKPRPTQREVTQPISPTGIRIPETEEAAAVAEVERMLAEENPNGPVARARAMTAETPVPPSPELNAIKAERIGSEVPSINFADVSHNVDMVTSPLTGKSIWARIGEALGWVNVIKRRIAQKKAAGKSYKPIDIG